MKQLLLAMLCLFAITTLCYADTVNGVLAEERVINLPLDSGKWYISVVGDTDNVQYQTILQWFDENQDLKKLKNQVHFCRIASNTAIYRERYSMNVKGLPTVRFQNHAGVVLYEAAGKYLPYTSEGLYGALANSVYKVQRRLLLPWRRQMDRRCPGPCPVPDTNPEPNPDLDPEPQPIDDGGAPVVDPVQSSLPPLWAMLVVLFTSALAGAIVEWRATYAIK